MTDKGATGYPKVEETVTFTFFADDIEAMELLCSKYHVTEDDFWECNAFDGSKIKKVISLVMKIVNSPSDFDDFMTREGREVIFDTDGNLLSAKGYTTEEVLDMKRSKNRLYEQDHTKKE